MRIRDVRIEELLPPPRIMSARQLAIQKRSSVLGPALAALERNPSAVKRVELEAGENIATMRAAVARQIKEEGRTSRVLVRGGAIFLAGRTFET